MVKRNFEEYPELDVENDRKRVKSLLNLHNDLKRKSSEDDAPCNVKKQCLDRVDEKANNLQLIHIPSPLQYLLDYQGKNAR